MWSYIILMDTYRLLCNLEFIFLYYLHKCNSLRVVILSLFLHVVINLIVVTNRNTRWHWLLKIIRCERSHQAAVPPSGSYFQKQMCIVMHEKNCVCVCVWLYCQNNSCRWKFIQCLNGKVGGWMDEWMDRFALGSSPYGPDAPRPYRWALCAP
jgi:hypothetical protein